MKDRIRSYLNVLSFIAVLIVNYLANALPLNGNSTAALSAKYNVLITPPGYVFSIWGLIYLFLGIWVVYQALPSQLHDDLFQKIGYWFILSCLFNCLWIFMWHYEHLALSLIVMVCLLLSLIVIYKKIQQDEIQSWLIRVPFSIYLGWISIATIVNSAVVLKYSGWSGFGLSEVTWTIIMLIIATVLGIYFSKKEDDIVYPLVFVWAFVGIGIRYMSSYHIISNTSFILAAVLLLWMIRIASKRNRLVEPINIKK